MSPATKLPISHTYFVGAMIPMRKIKVNQGFRALQLKEGQHVPLKETSNISWGFTKETTTKTVFFAKDGKMHSDFEKRTETKNIKP